MKTLEFALRKASLNEYEIALDLLRLAALRLNKRGIDQWQQWSEPSQEDKAWVEEGFQLGEFYFIENLSDEKMGMIRILEADELYWGKTEETALYIHSLTIKEEYSGNGLGKKVIDSVYEMARTRGFDYLRLDCDVTVEGEFDWLLSIANLQIVPEVLLAKAEGAVNFHDGPLPDYAGLNAPVWARLNGETKHGITWHLIENGGPTTWR